MNELMELRQLAQQTDNQKAVSLYNKVDKEIERLNNIINELEKYFEFLKMNSAGGNKEFMEDILNYIKALQKLKGSDKE